MGYDNSETFANNSKLHLMLYVILLLRACLLFASGVEMNTRPSGTHMLACPINLSLYA